VGWVRHGAAADFSTSARVEILAEILECRGLSTSRPWEIEPWLAVARLPGVAGPLHRHRPLGAARRRLLDVALDAGGLDQLHEALPQGLANPGGVDLAEAIGFDQLLSVGEVSWPPAPYARGDLEGEQAVARYQAMSRARSPRVSCQS
jgi:hypothetical protein